MSKTVSSPEDFFYLNKVMYKICGVWLPGRDVRVLKKILYFLYVLGYYTIYGGFLICEFLIFNEMLGDIGKFASYIGMLFTHLVGILKWSVVVFHRKRIQKMMNALQDPKYRYDPVDEFQPNLLLLEGKWISSIFTILLFVMYSGVGISADISSQISIHRAMKSDLLEGNLTCFDFMPYYFYVPFIPTTKRQCGYIFLFMDISLGLHAWLIACYDGVFVGILNCLKLQLIIVGGAFKTIRRRCLKTLNLPKEFSVLHDEENLEMERKLYEELNRCTKHLNLLLRTRDDIEHCFSYVTLAQTLASLFILATCLYNSSTIPITSPEFFSQLEYCMCILIQLSLICWFGNEITSASNEITLSIYDGDWYSTSPRFKRSMILTMCRMQRSVYLSIGKFSPLNLTTLVAVCRGSFSYFTVLKSVK
nr:odorant receptor [Semanotus bifasciatus]